MNTEAVRNALAHMSAEEMSQLAKAIDDAHGKLKSVHSGCDFECECWDAADNLEKALGLYVDED